MYLLYYVFINFIREKQDPNAEGMNTEDFELHFNGVSR